MRPTQTTDYSSRMVDMLLLQFVGSPVSDAVVKPDVSKDPRIVSGIEKLVQRFAILFLTVSGSVGGSPDDGTDFMKMLGSGMIYDERTLRETASYAVKSVTKQIRDEDDETASPDDEALASAELAEVSVDRTSATASVKIKITSAAGDSYTYVTPIATGV